MSNFDLANVTSLHSLSSGARIHIIGVCGVAMGALAIALSRERYEVSGSDKEFYPPISTMLENSPVKIFSEYNGDNITEDISLVIIGNSVPKTNPEVVAVKENNLPHTFFAKIAGEILLDPKEKSIVISGTHGKTTTTSIMAYGLQELERDPSYFIGGEVPQLRKTFHIGEGGEGVIEGDEYDSVFYVKRPKFLFYRPDILVVNALEFDHADIYQDLEAIEKEFDELLLRVPKDGVIIACADYEPVRRLLERYRGNNQNNGSKIVTFGESEDADFSMSDFSFNKDGSSAEIKGDKESFSIHAKLHGAINLKNVLATTLVARELKIEPKAWIDAISTFTGVSRRLELRFQNERVTLLEDFAHHPTAVREVIRTLNETYPDAEHWVAFEPRSNTSRRNIFQSEYGKSFAGIDRLFLREITSRASDTDQELMDVDLLLNDIKKDGVSSEVLPSGSEIGERILALLHEESKPVVITIMSNGAFDGLPAKLTAGLSS